MKPSRLPRGLTRTRTGWRIRLGPGGNGFRARFPATYTLEEMTAKLLEARQRTRAGRASPRSGTFDADITRYLAAFYQGRPGYAERKRHLELWRDELGAETPRDRITREDVSRVLHRWLSLGLHAETCNKRRTALMALYHALDGRSAANPVREVPKFRVSAPLARALDYRDIEAAFAKLPTCATRARLKMIAYTGARHGEVMRITPTDWDERRQTLILHGTRKGAGTKPRIVPLSQEAIDALREFEDTEAWGAFTWAPMARMWREAWIAATRKVSRADVRAHPARYADLETPSPYDLRHSFATRVYRETGDLRAVKELLGHASLAMSERYTLGAAPARAAAAMRSAFTPAKVSTRSAHHATLRQKSAQGK